MANKNPNWRKKRYKPDNRRRPGKKNRLSRLYQDGDSFIIVYHGKELVRFALKKVDKNRRVRFQTHPEVTIEHRRNGERVR